MIGAPTQRLEDARLLRGEGCFVDDLDPAGVVHAALLRSPHAHARIRHINPSNARAIDGVHLVLTAADLGRLAEPLPMLLPHPALEQPRTHVVLATDTVRYVGEPVAFVVADSRYRAEDARELIDVDYEPLPVVGDLEQAIQPSASLVHSGL